MTPRPRQAPLEQVQEMFPSLSWVVDVAPGSMGLWRLIGTSEHVELPALVLQAWAFGFDDETERLELLLDDRAMHSEEPSDGYELPALSEEAVREALDVMRRDLLHELRWTLLSEMRRPAQPTPLQRLLAGTWWLLDPERDPVEDLVDDWILLASDDRTEWTLVATSALLSTLQREPHMRPLEILRGCTWAEAKAIKGLWIEGEDTLGGGDEG